MLLEDAAALTELGDARVPGAALRDRDLELILRDGEAEEEEEEEEEEVEEKKNSLRRP